MPVEVIYVVRHAYRLQWTVDPVTGHYSSNTPTPTGIAADAQLASYGVEQSKQLAEKVTILDPPPNLIYSSPWYRCLQTIGPSVGRLSNQRKTNSDVRVENGIGEFFGTAHFQHPAPSSVSDLSKHFAFVDTSYEPQIRPARQGETLETLHDRLAYALERIIRSADEDPQQPRAILLCTHAAGMICIGRVLTGHMPADPTEEDFKCGTCAMSRFERRAPFTNTANTNLWDPTRPDVVPRLDWSNGKGVAGGWQCVVNGDCSFLKGGEERTWRFTGDESFINEPDVRGSTKL